MSNSVPFACKTSLIPRQCGTSSGAIAGPIVTESKPRRPWQNTTGCLGDRSTRIKEKGKTTRCTACHAHFLWIRDCSSSTVGARSSSLSRRSIPSLLSFETRHHEDVADVLNNALGDGKEGRGVCLTGRADDPLCRSRRERRASNEDRSGGECWRKMGAPGEWGSTGVSY
jgi:hypothetical protein